MTEELKKLIELGEGFHLELKENVDKSFIEEVCAFANSGGGKIILGVSDKRVVKGVKTENVTRSKIQDIINQLDPVLNGIKIIIEDNLFIIDVPQGVDKPYACSKGFFIRIGPNSQKLKRNEIIKFFKKEGRIHFDELENNKGDFDRDFNSEAFKHFVDISGISESIDQSLLMKNLDCITESGKLTNAGILFFAHSIEFIIPQATVVCVLYKGIEKVHIIDKKDFNGDIINNIESALQFLKRHINLEFKIENTRREEIYEIPEIAMREAVVNAVCHRDYFQKGANVLIEIFDDRIEITNPGGLPTELSPKDFGTKSVTRNSIIASLLLRADYIEKVGTGISRIKESVEKLGIGSVDFTYDDFFTVIFSRSSYILGQGGMETREKTREKILTVMEASPQITTAELSEILGISIKGVEWQVARLKQNGVIRRIGPDKGGRWEIIDNRKNEK